MKQYMTLGTTPSRSKIACLTALLCALCVLGVAGTASAAPATPQITTPPPPSYASNNSSLALSGTGTSGSVVALWHLSPSTTKIGEVTVSGGSWTYTIPALAEGSYLIAARATDSSGPSGPSDPLAVTIDQSAPEAPLIVGPTGTPASPAWLNQAAVLLQGVAEPLTTVKVYDNTTLVASTTAAVTGEWSVTTSALAQGTHSLRATSTDAAANVSPHSATQTVVIDTTSPPAPTISTPAGGTAFVASATTTIAGSAEAGSTVTLYDDGELLAEGIATTGTSWSFTGSIGEGTSVITAWAIDRAGNVSPASEPKGIIVDNVPPEVSADSPHHGSRTNNPAPPFEFSYVEQYPAAIECRVDFDVWTACGSGNQLAYLADGLHTFNVRVIDFAGNQAAASTQFTVDTQAPAAPSIGSGPDEPVSSTSASFSFSGEASGSFECALDTIELWQPCTSPQSYSSLGQGGHNFYVRQLDAAGNVGQPNVRTWVVDTVGPAAPNILGPVGTVADTGATISFNTSEAPATYTCSHNADAPTACTSPATLSGLSNGEHSFTVRAFDALGNASAPSTISWTIDTSLYSVTIFGGPVGVVGSAESNFEFSATAHEGSTYHCSIDSESDFDPCSSPYATGPLSDGEHTLRVYAVNGSWTSATVAASWTIDTTPPAITVDEPLEGETTGTSGQFVFETSDATGGVSTTCQLDGAEATPCSSPVPFYALEGGPHTITIAATDAVGNVGTLSRHFNVDGTAPQTTILSGPAETTNSTTANLSFSSDKPLSTFACWLDGDAIPCDPAGTPLSGLAEGSHAFVVVATDTLGNADPTPAVHVWSVDTTAPAAPAIGSPPVDITTSETSIELSGFAEQGSLVRVFDGIDELGSATAGPDGVWRLSPDPNLSEGAHELTATATDSAGNTGASSALRRVVIDKTDPVVTIISPSDGELLARTSATIEFEVDEQNPLSTQCSLDGGAFAACTSPWTSGVLDQGLLHTFSVLSVDQAGNQSLAQVTFRLDTSPPARPALISPADDSFSQTGAISVTGYAEPGSSVTVDDEDGPLCTATAGGDGQFTCSPATAFSEGSHTLSAIARDAAGNASERSEGVTFTVDSVVPTISIDSPLPDAVAGTDTPTIAFSATDTGSTPTAQCSVDNAPPAPCTSPWTAPPLLDGVRTVNVIVHDAAGNAAGASVTFSIDTGPPTVIFTAAPAQSTPQTSASFSFVSDDTHSEFECRIDSSNFAPCVSPAIIAGPLTAGFHSFHVRARDHHQNLSTEVTYTWIVGSALPTPPGGNGGPSGPYDPVPKACFKSGVLITAVALRGKKVTVSGFASIRHVGKKVGVAFRSKPGKRLGGARVRGDGRFTLKVKAPTKGQRRSSRAAYRANVGKERSGWAPLASRFGSLSATWSGEKLRIRGKLVKPLVDDSRAVVHVRDGCNGGFNKSGDADVSRSGKFSTSFPFATRAPVIFVRVDSVVKRSARSRRTLKVRSLVLPVRTH